MAEINCESLDGQVDKQGMYLYATLPVEQEQHL